MVKIKNLMVSFIVIAMALFLATTVSAAVATVTVDGINISENDVSVIAGKTITVRVYFEHNKDLSDVIIKAELDDVVVETEKFDVIANKLYRKVLNIKVPYNFDAGELKKDLDLEITVKGKEGTKKVTFDDFSETLTVQKPTYNIDFKSINVAKSVNAGESFTIDMLLKNSGYNRLDDLYVTVKIAELGIRERFYFGDLVSVIDDKDNDTDTINKRLTLKVPYGVASGTYTLEVEVSNDDVKLSKNVMIDVVNRFPETVIKSGNDLILVNPTDKVVGFKIVPATPATVDKTIVFVQAGSTETVTITSNAEGEYEFDVVVLTMDGEIVSTVTFSGSENESPLANPIVILTVVLAIIFLVLLVSLIVLITKKPEKTEEFGESYY